jgi:hypothetical protein
MNASLSAGSIVERAVGFLRLDSPTYEDVERDTNATTQAAIIVLLAGIAAGIGSVGDGAASLIAGPIASLAGWVISAAFVFFVGTRLIPSTQTSADLGQVLRVYGFASVAGIANVLGFIPVLGPIIALAAGIWGIVMTVKAIKHALEMSTGRAIATAIIAAILAAIVLAIIGGILGVSLLAVT